MTRALMRLVERLASYIGQGRAGCQVGGEVNASLYLALMQNNKAPPLHVLLFFLLLTTTPSNLLLSLSVILP
jgi:hypothetical protein